MKNITTIPGIKAVYCIPAGLLPPQISYKTSVGIQSYVADTITQFTLAGNAEAEIVDEYKNNGRTVKTTLTFRSCCDMELQTPLAFIYTDVLDRHFLVGTKEKPFPVVSKKKTTGVPGSSSAVIEYTVTWLSQHMPPQCSIVSVL